MNIYTSGYEIITLTALKKIIKKNQMSHKVSIDHSSEEILMKY